MSTLTITTVEDIVAKYSQTDDDSDNRKEFVMTRKAELSKMTKDQLMDFIVSLEYKPGSKIKVGDVAKAILRDPDFITASHQVVADAIKIIVPGAETSAKSVATYVSKQGAEWDLPERIIIRQSKPRVEVEVEVEPAIETEVA